MKDTYQLLDCGDGKKLEQFGDVTLARPAGQAVWRPSRPKLWADAIAQFDRENGLNWKNRSKLPEEWVATIAALHFRLSTTDFGHIGVFPEQATMWSKITEMCVNAREHADTVEVLNLFAYSGGSTLAAARGGASVCHVDASKGMVDWARRNAALNDFDAKPIRWIVDDVRRFVQREIRREKQYQGIILDPPSFGRGKKGEIFKIEQNLLPLLYDLKQIAPRPMFVLLSCHTPELTGLCLTNLLHEIWAAKDVQIQQGEMVIPCVHGYPALPSGSYALLTREPSCRTPR